MKTLAIAAAFFCFTTGCASMTNDVFKNIHEGDSATKVSDTYGAPDLYQPSFMHPGAQTWQYTKNGDTCAFAIKNNAVLAIACKSGHGNFRRGMSSVLKGAGQGLQNASNRQTQCTTTGGNGYYNTNCY